MLYTWDFAISTNQQDGSIISMVRNIEVPLWFESFALWMMLRDHKNRILTDSSLDLMLCLYNANEVECKRMAFHRPHGRWYITVPCRHLRDLKQYAIVARWKRFTELAPSGASAMIVSGRIKVYQE